MLRNLRLRLRALIGNQFGGTAVEYGLVFSLMILVTLGTVEVGLMMWQWNSAEKATQVGVRHAAVRGLVAPGLQLVGDAPTSGGDYGDWCRDRTTNTANADCWFDTVTCTSDGCSGGYGYDADAFDALVQRMRTMFPLVEPENVEIDYAFSGLGFIGRPGGQPMVVTVRLRNMRYDFFLLDVFTALPDLISMPTFAATLVGEDMSDSTL